MKTEKIRKISDLNPYERTKLINRIARGIAEAQGAVVRQGTDILEADYTNAHPRAVQLRQASINALNVVEAFLENQTARRLTLEEMFGGSGDEEE
jgi:hypothetical protein